MDQQQYFDTGAPQPIFSDSTQGENGENPVQTGKEPSKNPAEGEENAEVDPKLLEDQQITKAKSVLADGTEVPAEGVTSDIQNRIMMSLNDEEKKIIAEQEA